MTPELLCFQCPICQRKAEIEKKLDPIGKRFLCKKCNNYFILSKDNQYIEKSSSVALMKFSCIHCERIATVQKQNNLFGRKLRCKGCNDYFVLSQSNLQMPTNAKEEAFLKKIRGLLNSSPSEKKEFGKFTLEAELGKGAMGKVYKTYDPNLNKVVALKMLIDGVAVEEKYEKRFLREAKATKKLDHPNIVKIYEMGHIDNQHFFTMELIEGITFREFLKKEASQEAILKIFAKIVHTIEYVHRQGIVHRDLKPSNIMITENMEPKVMDFGLVKMADFSKMTTTGTILGTLKYMAPEQAEGKVSQIDFRTDIYSLGVMLYEVLTGQVPFLEETAFALVAQIVHEKPVPPHVRNNNISPQLSQVCLQAIEKDKKARYQTIEHFFKEFSNCITYSDC